MSYWGNDIVALDDPDFQTEDRIDRWIAKVCTQKETEYLSASARKNLDRWRLWSCKESVYKVLMKTGVTPFLNSRRIEIIFEASVNTGTQNFIATFEGSKFWGSTILNDNWVHSICCDLPIENQICNFEVINTDADTASQELRVKVKDVLEVKHNIKVDRIVKSPSNVPTIVCLNTEKKVDLSFSHHAPYSAYLFHVCKKKAN